MHNGGNQDNSWSHITGQLTLAVPTTFEIRHYCSTTSTFGLAANIAQEIYTQVEITKIK
jgi:hypothetical protein